MTKISPIRAAIQSLSVGETAIVGPYTKQSTVYSQISRFAEEGTEFKVRKLNSVNTKFTEIIDGAFEIKRIK